jgi:predicted anti-sigma-YlaC factor YlaD
LKPDKPPSSDTGGGDRCALVVAALRRYFARELTPQECRTVDSHLAGCPSCRSAAEGYGEVIRLARSLPLPVPPPGVERRLRELIASVIRTPSRVRDIASDDTLTELPLS